MTTMKRLAKNVFSTSIHRITGVPYEEGTLEAGALIRGIQRHDLGVDADGERIVKTTFEASTDGGESWYVQDTYVQLEVEK